MRWLTGRSLCGAAVILFAAALSGSALANGRFPEAQTLREHPGDPERLYLTGTWGMLLTQDRGNSWYYICEQAFAHTIFEGDPVLEVLPDGTLLSGIFETLNRSTDCGCSWPAVLGQADTQSVVDLTQDGAGNLVALIQDISMPSARAILYESDDDGQTWAELSMLPEDVVRTYTLDVAPSDASRIYVSGFSRDSGEALLLVSTNGGTSWTRRSMPGTTTSILPYIAAVHPTDSDQVFIRTDNWDFSQSFAADDGLWVTRDAGETFELVLRKQAKLLGFALSPDGDTVLAGYGDPVLAGLTTNSEEFGIYKANTNDFSFEQVLDLPVSCLRWTENGLYVCAIQNHSEVPAPGLALGFAKNVDFTLATLDPLTPLLDLTSVNGPALCTQAVCTETWAEGINGTVAACQQLRADCEIDSSQNELVCVDAGGGGGQAGGPGEAGAAGDAGSAGNGGTAGASDGSGGTLGGNAGDTGSAGTAGAGDAGGCSCQLAQARRRTSPLAAALLLFGLLGLRRSQRVS